MQASPPPHLKWSIQNISSWKLICKNISTIQLFLFILAPSVNPSYIWLTNTIRNNQVPANPPILVNGTVGVVNGGLFMDGATGSLDAGEFNGMFDKIRFDTVLSL